MPLKGKLLYTLLGVVLTLLVLYPIVKTTFREQSYGLMMTPEEVKGLCGPPQSDNGYVLTYLYHDHHVELGFMGVQHRMFLTDVKWTSSTGAGHIRQVTKDQISDYVRHDYIPICLEDLAK
jgi:hypothetical protein